MAKQTNTMSKLPVADIYVDDNDNARSMTDKGYDRDGSLKGPDGVTIASLARSIKTDGLLQNLTVREHTAAEQKQTGKSHRLVAGFRRMTAILTIKSMDTVPVTILRADATKGDIVAAGLVENMQREALNPAEKAVGLMMLRDAIKEDTDKFPSFADLAKRVGISKSYANHLCNLREKLCPRVWDEFAGGHPSATVIILVQRVMGFEDPDAQWEAWLIASDQKKADNEGGGDGEGGEDGGDGGDTDAPDDKPKRATAKQIERAIDGLNLHKKSPRAKSEEYYKGAADWLRWALDTNRKSPLSIEKLLEAAEAAEKAAADAAAED